MIDLIIYISQLLKKIIIFIVGVLCKDLKYFKKLIKWFNEKISKKSIKFFVLILLLINLCEILAIGFMDYNQKNNDLNRQLNHCRSVLKEEIIPLSKITDEQEELNKRNKDIDIKQIELNSLKKESKFSQHLKHKIILLEADILWLKKMRDFTQQSLLQKSEGRSYKIAQNDYCASLLKYSSNEGKRIFLHAFLTSFYSPEIFSPNTKSIKSIFYPHKNNFEYLFLLTISMIINVLANYSLLICVLSKKGVGNNDNKKITVIFFIIFISWIFSTLPFFL